MARLKNFARLFDVYDGQVLVFIGDMDDEKEDHQDLCISIATDVGVNLQVTISMPHDRADKALETFTQEAAEAAARGMLAALKEATGD